MSERNYVTFDKNIGAYKTTSEDAGYDMYSLEDKWLWPLMPTKVLLNFAIELKEGEMALVTSRSGQSLKGNFVIPGICDSGYRGQISAIMVRLHILPKKIKKGERVAQLIIMDYKKPDLDKVNELAKNSSRGTKGYGSSGVM